MTSSEKNENLKYCPNYSVAISAYDHEKSKRYIMRTRCKQWDCPYCANKNKRGWRYRIMATVESLGDSVEWYLWTLTLSPITHASGSTVTSLQVWRDSWNKLMGKLRYAFGKFMYCRVFETHKTGILHVHMLANVTFDDVVIVKHVNGDQTVNNRHESAKLRDIMKSYGLGVIHDIKPIETENHDENGHARNVSAYVTKYMTKDIQSDVRKVLRDGGAGKVRMIQTSHGWAKIEKSGDHKWTVGRILFHEYYSDLQSGIQLVDVQLGIDVEGVHFEDDEGHSVYPPQSEMC